MLRYAVLGADALYHLSQAARALPIGTACAVVTAIGAAGGVASVASTLATRPRRLAWRRWR